MILKCCYFSLNTPLLYNVPTILNYFSPVNSFINPWNNVKYKTEEIMFEMRNCSKIYFSKFIIKEVDVNNVSLPLELFSCWLSVSENRRDYPHETWSPSRFSPCTCCTGRSGKTVCWGYPGPDHIQESVLWLWPLISHRDSSMVCPDPEPLRSHQTWSCSQAPHTGQKSPNPPSLSLMSL